MVFNWPTTAQSPGIMVFGTQSRSGVLVTTEILLCVYLLHCKLEPNQCNIEENNKHRIGWLKVDERSIRMEIVVYKS